MLSLERLLEPGSTDLPDCKCGKEMRLTHSKPVQTDTTVRTYVCTACGHEMRLTVWSDRN